MAKYIVKKSGPLKGEVAISGAKNAVLPLMAATLLNEEECVIRDVPQLRDVALMKEILASLGSKIEELEENIYLSKFHSEKGHSEQIAELDFNMNSGVLKFKLKDDDKLYKCKEDSVTGNWDETKWEQTDITGEVKPIYCHPIFFDFLRFLPKKLIHPYIAITYFLSF